MSDVERRANGSGYVFHAGESELARYVTEHDAPALESPRPYLHPVRTLSGTVVSGYRPADHDWHWGLSIAIANIDVPGEELPVNLWGGVTFLDADYVQLNNNGDQVHEGWGDDGDDNGIQRLTWRTAAGRPFLAERRTLNASVLELADGRAAWRLDLTSTWTNLLEDAVEFGSPTTAGRENAGYGGMFLRAAPDFAAATVLSPGGPIDASAAMGSRPAWLALAIEGATVALAADPGNPVSDSPFFVRTETPMLCAAPFFFDTWSLTGGATATWRWSLLVSDGRLDVATIAHALSSASGRGE